MKDKNNKELKNNLSEVKEKKEAIEKRVEELTKQMKEITLSKKDQNALDSLNLSDDEGQVEPTGVNSEGNQESGS